MKKIKVTQKKIEPKVIMTGLICLTILEMFALSQGINGTLLKIVLMVIAATIGITIKTPKILGG